MTKAKIPFELTSSSSGETVHHGHQTPFLDHKEGGRRYLDPPPLSHTDKGRKGRNMLIRYRL